MPSIGSASLTITPKFDNLGKSVTAALNGVDATASGEKIGEGFSNGVAKGTSGLLKSGALMGVFSAATTKALDLIGGSVSGATSRLDTLNNYPRVMQALGYSAEESSASVAKMSDHLTGLPTALNDMTSYVQQLSASTGDIAKATDLGLGFNDMLLASGASYEAVASAQYQFNQMLATGHVDMQAWRSLVQAAPGQMNQLASSILGATATQGDLYQALQDGTLSMEDMSNAIIALDNQGGDGFQSFADQAKNATGGIETSMANMQTAVTRGLADVLDSIGTENIAQATSDIGKGFENGLKLVGDGISAVMPTIKSFWETTKQIGPSLVPAIAGVAGLAAAGKGLSSLATFAQTGGTLGGIARSASGSFAALAAKIGETGVVGSKLGGISKVLGGAMGGPLVAGIGLAAAAVGIFVGFVVDGIEKQKKFETATTGLSDAAKRTAALDEYAGRVDNVGEKAESTALSVDKMIEVVAGNVDKMNDVSQAAETQISQLDTAMSTIDSYTGQTDLSAEAQGKLEWAIKQVNDQFGLTITSADVARGAYTDTEGNVVNLKDAIYDLIEAKKEEIRVNALSENFSTALESQATAADTLAAAQKKVNDETEQWVENYMSMTGKSREEAEFYARQQTGLSDLNGKLAEAREEYRATTEAVDVLAKELGDASVATSEAADAFDKWGNTTSPLFNSTLRENGTSIAGLKDDLRALGVDTESLVNMSETELLSLANDYNGTAASAAGSLDRLGVKLDDEKTKTALAADDIASSLRGMGIDASEALNGITIDDFARKLAEAGVSTDELNAIGSQNLAQLAVSCGGSVEAMVFYLQHYNDTPIVDKDGNVTAETASLIDAQGRIYTWNGSELIDQESNAVVNDVSLIDAQGNLLTWNGSALTPKWSNASINDASVQNAISRRSDWNYGDFWNKTATATIDIFRNITDFFSGSGHASGGFRLNAEGGYRFHAGGAIATKAMPLDIVGEDGAEAIVPLTNRKYSEPFARTLAEQIGFGGATVNYNISLEGLRVNDDKGIRTATLGLIKELQRKGDM